MDIASQSPSTYSYAMTAIDPRRTIPLRSLLKLLMTLCALTVTSTILIRASEQAAASSIPAASDILARLRPGHPRLLGTKADFDRLRTSIEEDATLKAWHATLAERGTRLLDEPTSKYKIPDGLRLLSVSRRVLDRVYTLAMLYRLEDDRRYAERAWRELDAAAAFPDWNPRHFLDTAEMTHAFGIGYDWLHDFWTPDQRERLRTAIVEKGLRLGVECYRGNASYRGWTKSRHNWNQVCNGGIGMGALAIAEVDPGLAGEFLHAALASLQLPMREFGPDGAWAEGPGYWNYATRYNVALLAALETALGTDFGLSEIPGFSDTGMFPLYVSGPLGRTFNYADGGDGAINAPHMFWLARRFQRPAYAAYQVDRATPAALDLLWFDPKLAQTPAAQLPLDRRFRSAEIATFRSAWADRNAVFAGFKGGDNKVNHSHLDLGSFVLDAGGSRWIVDPGADNYNLPGYFGRQRWTYYRLRAEGQNTIVINPASGPDQEPSAAAPLIQYESNPNVAFAIADLTAANAGRAGRVWRGLALLDRRDVLVQDEIEGETATNIWWFAHTQAEIAVKPDGRAAVLTQQNKRMLARMLPASGPARFEVLPARPLASSPNPSGQAPNDKLRKLAIHFEDQPKTTISVVFTLLDEEGSEPKDAPPVVPLRSWNAGRWR